MRTRLVPALGLLLLLTLTASPSPAALLGIQIVVQQNSGAGFVTVGTALGGPAGASTPLLVNNCCPGNTIRFTVQYDQVASFNAYATSIRADDPTEIDFLPGSATDLSGKGFAGFLGNPNNSMNDATPADGGAHSAGSGTVTGQNLYLVDYVVLSADPLVLPVDFSVNLTGVGSGNTINTLKREASVSLFNTSLPPCPVPEPFSLGLVLSALAGLGFLRRRP